MTLSVLIANKLNVLKKTEQIVFIAALAAGIVFSVIQGISMSYITERWAEVAMHAMIIVFIGHLLVSLKKISLITAGLGLMALMSISIIMSKFRLEGAAIMFMISMAGQILMGIGYVLYWNKNRQEEGATFLMVIGLAMIGQMVLGIVSEIIGDADYSAKALMLNYVFLGGIGTIKISQNRFTSEIDKSLFLPILTAIPYVISSTVSLLFT